MSPKKSTNNDEVKGIFGNRRKDQKAAGSGADWAMVNPESLSKLVRMVTSRGGAIRFGYTRDGGAYAVGLYYGGESDTEYVRPSEDLEEKITEWIALYEELPNSGGVAPKS
jgi:hypothetical protein